MADFEVHISPKAKKLSQLTLNNQTGEYDYPPAANLPPMGAVAYNQLVLDIQAATATMQQKYGALKTAIQRDVLATGGDPNDIEFDDANRIIKLGNGYKDCMDRFADGDTKKMIREASGVTDPNAKFQDIFREQFATPQAKQGYADQGSQSFAGLRTTVPKDPATAVDVSGANGADEAIDTIFKSQPGITLDDIHSAPDAPKMLVDNMDEFEKAGITTLFIEHFWAEQQDEIDEYLNSGPTGAMPAALMKAVEKLDAVPGFNGEPCFANLLAAAKKSKIRIVGLDSFNAKVKENQDPRRWEDRVMRFNKSAADIVQREKGGGKFVLLAGEAHNNTHGGGIPGMAQLLGVHNFNVAGGTLAKSPETKPRGMRSDPAQAFYDGYCAAFHELQPNAPADVAYEDIEEYVRSQTATLDKLTPAAAKRLGEMIAKKAVAQMAADHQDLAARSDKGKLKSATEKGGSLLHIAAAENDTALMTELITAGQSATATDQVGNTALHRLLIGGNKDVAASSKLLLDKGASLATPNTAGSTPLHNALAIDYLNPPFLKWVDDHKADFKRAAAVKKGDLEVVDMVMARGDHALEDKMYDDGIVNDTAITVQSNAPKTTPEILAMATICDDAQIRPDVVKYYEKLYDDFPEFRSTLDVAALSALGNRRNKKALRLIMCNSDNPGKVTTKGGFGAFDDGNNTLALGVQRDEETLLGTMIHELTHHAVKKVFDNETMPFPVNDPGHTIEQGYLGAIATDVGQGPTAFGKKDGDLAETLTGRVDEYLEKKGGDPVKMRRTGNQEYIAGVPQALVLHGRDAMERRGGGLLDFWDQTMRPAMKNLVDNDPEVGKLKKQGRAGKPYKADDPWASADQLDAGKISAAIMSKLNVDHGTCNKLYGSTPGKPAPYNAKQYDLPEAVRAVEIKVVASDDAAALRKKLANLQYSLDVDKPGWYDPVMQKINLALAQPNADRQTLENAIRDINTDVAVGDRNAKAFNDNRKAAAEEIKKALQKVLDSGKLPDNVHTGVLQAFTERMIAAMGTGPVDVNQIKKLVAKSAVDLVTDARTASSRKGAVDERAEKQARYRHFISNGLPIDAAEFAEAAVLEAERQYALENPSPDGIPAEVDKSKQTELIAKLAQNLDGKPPQDFKKYVDFVKNNVLYTKGANKAGKRDKSHQSIAKRRQWVVQLGQL